MFSKGLSKKCVLFKCTLCFVCFHACVIIRFCLLLVLVLLLNYNFQQIVLIHRSLSSCFQSISPHAIVGKRYTVGYHFRSHRDLNVIGWELKSKWRTGRESAWGSRRQLIAGHVVQQPDSPQLQQQQLQLGVSVCHSSAGRRAARAGHRDDPVERGARWWSRKQLSDYRGAS